jgi:hypothetical protein
MSIFNETLPNFVQKEIKGRQNNLANRNNINVINSKTAWVRMTSGVNVLDKNGQLSNKIAKDNVIFNILGGNTTTSGSPMVGYTTGNRHGIRPLPGINSLNCQSYAPNGSLRKVVVKFTVWDIKQLDLLEILYMRPGMSVCIEWGWSHKLADNKTNQPPNFGTKFLDMEDKSLLSLHKMAYEEIISNGGNFDICIGKVQNYSYSARMDGGFDCETTIVSYNEILESFKVNYIPLNMETTNNDETVPLVTANSVTYDPSDTNLQSKYAEGIIPGILYELYQRGLVDDQGGSGTIRDHNYEDPITGEVITYSLFSLKLPPGVINKTTDPDVIANNATSIFVKFGDFINMLNSFVLFNNKSGTITSVDVKGMKCAAHPFQFSTNPAVCIISADGWIKANNQIKSDLNNVKDESTNPTPGVTPPNVSYKGNITKLNQLISEIRNSSSSTATFLSLVEDELKNGATSLGQAINNVWQHIADLNPTPSNENGSIVYKFDNGVWTYTSPDGKSAQLNKFLNLTGGTVDKMTDLIVFNIEALYNRELDQRDNKYGKIVGSLGIGILERNNFERNFGGTNYHLKDSAVNRIKKELESLIVNKTYYFNESSTTQFTEVATQGVGETLGGVLSNLNKYSFFRDTGANSDYRTGRIENIFINLDFIYKLVKPKSTNVDDKNKKNEIAFNQLMSNILLEVQNSIGSVNSFEIYGDGIETGKTYIIDRSYIDPVAYKDLFSFELDNTSSTAKNYSIRSQIFPEQSSIVAISTQAQSGKLGYSNRGLINYNYGITDRIVGTIDSGAEFGNTTKAEQKKSHINQALSQIATAVTQLYIGPASSVDTTGVVQQVGNTSTGGF